MIDVSIAVPSIRPQNWSRLLESLDDQNCSWEIFFIGPNKNSQTLPQGAMFIEDWGAPTRCTQIAAAQASGQYFIWVSDDGVFHPQALANAVDFCRVQLKTQDEMIVRYTEGANFKTNTVHHKDQYWTAKYHKLHLNAGVLQSDRIAPLGMLELKQFKSMGGFDCKYEHINMSCIDLSLRIQRSGGVLYLSPEMILKFDWQPNCPDYPPVQDAYVSNDLPLFRKHYSHKSRPSNIGFDNWKDSPESWRRFK